MVDAAEVRIWDTLVGAIRWDQTNQLGYFQYAPSFLELGWDLSPLKMPIANGNRIYSFPALRRDRDSTEDTFKGLPGLLADALPDKYGNRLMQAWLAQQGRGNATMNPVEKLCFIGDRGMGALSFVPGLKSSYNSIKAIEINSLVNVAKQVLSERKELQVNLSENEQLAMSEILKIGTSAGGARPKAVIAFNPKTKEVRSGQLIADEGFEDWLIKLDGVSDEQFGDSAGWGRVEFAYYQMAIDCGITMEPCQLFEENGRAHFMTKRFDRTGPNRHHVQTLCGLQHYDFNDMYSFSYEQVFQTMRQLRLTYPEAEEMFRRMVFNVLATNCDDHTKNFAFMLKKNEQWRLAPAYDLCFAYDPTNHWVNQQTLSVNGKRQRIDRNDFLQIAKENNIKQPNDIIDAVKQVVSNWQDYAAQVNVKNYLKKRIQNQLVANSFD